jgi:integrase/recombinase XerD
MKEQIRLSFYLDNRRKKTNNVYPIKLRLYQPRTIKERLFRTGFDLTEEEFNQGYLKKNPEERKNKFSRIEKEELETKILKLNAIKVKSNQILNDLQEFSFEEFEKRFYNKASSLDVCDYFEEYIENLKAEGRYRTAESYSLGLHNLKIYYNHNRKKEVNHISFDSITKGKLQGFENYFLEKGHSAASIGIYLRPLRAIFNYAIADPNSGIKPDLYPFGRKKYTIPTGQNIKKALTNYQLKTLFEMEPKNEFQQRAKAFWFFSYLANGMNFKDIADLKFSDIKGNRLSFYRSKTKRSTKSTPALITAILPDYALNIIKQYGNDTNFKTDYIFPILQKTDKPEAALKKVKAFILYTNTHIKNMVIAYNNNLKEKSKTPPDETALLPEEISTYWARHSFTTQAIRKGASMELLQESLGHKNITTTQNYFAGFPVEVKENLSKTLLQF